MNLAREGARKGGSRARAGLAYLADRIIVLSNKPATVREVVTVTAPRPRDPEHDADLKRQRAQLISIFETIERHSVEDRVS